MGEFAQIWTPDTGVLIGPGMVMDGLLPTIDDPRSIPAYVAQTPVNVRGTEGWRLMSVFRTAGCERKRAGSGCSMCGFEGHADPSITDDHIRAQSDVVAGLLSRGGFMQADLLTLGNFFNDSEFSPQMRDEILSRMSTIDSLQRVVVESRREYVTAEKLREAKGTLRDDQILTFAFGYESKDPRIRNDVLGKGVPEFYLTDCLGMCRDTGVHFSAYVLIKPPGLTEAQAIREAVDTAVHVFQTAMQYAIPAHVMFEPLFVAPGTGIERMFLQGEYRTPWLWSVLEVIGGTMSAKEWRNAKGQLFVGMSDEGLSDGRFATNCGKCDKRALHAIQIFNNFQDASEFHRVNCDCEKDWDKEMYG